MNFREPDGDSALARLQRWTFEVFSSQPEGRRDIIEEDESIVINSCHGPMREAEVFTRLFAQKICRGFNSSTQGYYCDDAGSGGLCTLYRATFGGMEKNMPQYFPFSIVDREPRQESHLVDCFFDLLEFLKDGQLTVMF